MSKWIPTWHCVPIDYGQDIVTLENVTQTCLFVNDLDGEQVRVRFNNLYGEAPLRIRHAAIFAQNRVTGKRSAPCALTLHGSEDICVAANSRPYSDPAALRISHEDDLILSLYFEQKTALRSVCITSACYSWQSTHQTGNFYETEALGFTVRSQLSPVLAADPYPNQFAAGVCEVGVCTESDAQLVGLFGDSVTHMSYFGDCLLAALMRRFPGRYAVANGGISGNRIQKSHPVVQAFPGGGSQFGPAGRDRLLADLYDGATPDIVFVLEGVNDCTHSIVFQEPDVPTAQDIFDALADTVRTARAQGSRVYIGTIPPFGAFGEPWREQAEALRCQYNDHIRASDIADGVVDLDAVLRDPDDPHRMQAGMHLGDGVHPNWHGGAKMARAVLEQLFLQP